MREISQILRKVLSPLICRKKRSQKPKVLERINHALHQYRTGNYERLNAKEPGDRSTKIDESKLGIPSGIQCEHTDDNIDKTEAKSGTAQDSENGRRGSSKKRKAGRTRTNKFKVHGMIERDAGDAPLINKLNTADTPETDDLGESIASPLDLQMEGTRPKKLTRAEKKAAACKVKESLPRYLRINSLLGMSFREVQKALLASGCVPRPSTLARDLFLDNAALPTQAHSAP